MAFRVGGRRSGGQRRGRPVANAEVLEAMQQMQGRLEAVEMGNQEMQMLEMSMNLKLKLQKKMNLQKLLLK